MRVKLSYTVDAEDVLKEAAKIINLQAEDLQYAVNLFKKVQSELRGDNSSEGEVVNINLAQELIEEFRKSLLSVDRRLEEVTEIVRGYDDYLRSLRPESLELPKEPEDNASDVTEYYGAD